MGSRRVFRKTTKGIEEVEGTIHALDRLARRILILIDGHRAIDELAPMLTPGETELVCVQLQADGYIEPLDAPSSLTVTGRLRIFGSATPTLEETKSAIAQEIANRLGEFAETVNAELEPCSSISELSQKLRETDRFVMAVLGDVHGAAFTQKVASLLSRATI
jgi:hypothetical protein